MAKLVLRLEFEKGPARWILTGLILALAPVELTSENLTLTTTYPAPFGVYTQLVTTGKANGSALDTTLNRDGGNTILAPGGGLVGVGTNSPAMKLDVSGASRISGALTVTGGIASRGGIDLGGAQKVVNSADPSAPQDLATKAYVDRMIASLGKPQPPPQQQQQQQQCQSNGSCTAMTDHCQGQNQGVDNCGKPCSAPPSQCRYSCGGCSAMAFYQNNGQNMSLPSWWCVQDQSSSPSGDPHFSASNNCAANASTGYVGQTCANLNGKWSGTSCTASNTLINP